MCLMRKRTVECTGSTAKVSAAFAAPVRPRPRTARAVRMFLRTIIDDAPHQEWESRRAGRGSPGMAAGQRRGQCNARGAGGPRGTEAGCGGPRLRQDFQLGELGRLDVLDA